MKEVDLHMHSTHSDGTMSPRELVAYAEKKKLRAIAVSDHDTLSHIRGTLCAGEASSVEVIAAIEVSADFSPGTMHILGYFVDAENEELFEMLERFREGRAIRNPQIIEKLNNAGMAITYDEVLREAGGQSVGRPHIATVMVKKGFVRTTQDAFEQYLKKGALAYVDRLRFNSEEIIRVIHNAGGLAFLAHPKQLLIASVAELEALVEKLIAQGLDGIEVYSSSHNKRERKIYANIAEKYSLLVSGGSDFHGTHKNGIDMGFLGTGVKLSYDVVEKMKAALAKRSNS